jgi:hypothetical protein
MTEQKKDADESSEIIDVDSIESTPMDNLISTIRQQVVAELKSDKARERQDAIMAREDAKKAQTEFVDKMKASADPWVDIQGWVETDQGVRVELDWNNAFVQHLKDQGVSGADDDQIVQQWVVLLLRDMTEKLVEDTPESSEFS